MDGESPVETGKASRDLRRYLSVLALVVVNLIPIAGVLLFDWDVAALVVLYWSENLVIGFYTILKMLVVSPVGGIFSSFFLLIHYGGFCAGHGLFISILLLDAEPDVLQDSSWPMLLIFVELLFEVSRAVLAQAPPEWLWAFAALVFSHGVSFVQNFLLGGEYRRADMGQLMVSPYARMFVLHFAILAGGFAVLALGQNIVMLLALVALKLGMDIHLHLREHRRFAGAILTD